MKDSSVSNREEEPNGRKIILMFGLLSGVTSSSDEWNLAF